MWDVPQALAILPEQQRTLEAWIAARNTPQKVAFRSRIVLMAAEGKANRRIAQELQTSRPTVILWRQRFAEGGPTALTEEAPGRGRKPRISSEKVKQIVEATLHTKPKAATHWSVRSMAKAQGVSPATVQRIWDAHGLEPHRTRSFKLSRDKQFVEKLTDVVGLYLNPPDKAVVLCMDEKSQIQALNRTQPSLPMKKGRCGTLTHDYQRNGTTTLFAALHVLEGTVIGDCKSHHRHQEFIQFLRRLDREFPLELDLHLILDNYGTHKHPKVKSWLARHRRFHLHFTPTSSSWLNLVERWFAKLTEQRIRRGSFFSIKELKQAIQEYLDDNNRQPKPFIWTASVEKILEKVNRCKAILETAH
ncbi:MAG TPA: IS630 family transposase [Terriglobales bacterium]|nr:IS630 family transposase [Terriglobales bacterium]